jgi:tetratricopeptide (TPR) repeat protein
MPAAVPCTGLAVLALSLLPLSVLACSDDAHPPAPAAATGSVAPSAEPDYGEYLRLADRAGREGRWDDVLRHLREAIRLGPYDEERRYLLGSVWLEHGDLEAMVEYYRGQIATDPKPQTSHFFLGRALAARGDLDAAVEEYHRAIEADPAHELSHQAWAEILEERGELAEAERHYRRAVAIDPTFDAGWDDLLRFLGEHGSTDELEAARRAAAAADGDPRHRPYYWAKILVEEGRPAAAREELERVFAVAPEFEPARRLGRELGMEVPE